jgi:hypothetical protein
MTPPSGGESANLGPYCDLQKLTGAHSAVNLDGVFLSMKYAGAATRRTGGGSIIIMSSVAGRRGWRDFARRREASGCSQRR